jgi:hypothetical protein
MSGSCHGWKWSGANFVCIHATTMGDAQLRDCTPFFSCITLAASYYINYPRLGGSH